MRGKTIYRVVKQTEDFISADNEFLGRAEAKRWAKRWASNGNWTAVYILKQGCFDAWNDGEEIWRQGTA